MKTLDELRDAPNLMIRQTGIDGGNGIIFKDGKQWASVIWSTGAGWDHVSIAPFNRRIVPSWDDMCRLKDMFFYDFECCVQYHPPKERYVNQVPNCLHIWAPLELEMPVPPDILVGVKRGQSKSSVEAAIRELGV